MVASQRAVWVGVQCDIRLVDRDDRFVGIVAGSMPGLLWPTVGFDPHRPEARSRLDYLYVAASVAAVIAMVAWAVLG